MHKKHHDNSTSFDFMNQPLIIQITNPCLENWNEMSEVEQGKFCSHCQKTVIDFSMKTDAELLEYFAQHTSFCGRFRNNQLDRIIETPKPTVKRLFDFYSKAAALFFTIFSFKSYQTKAQSPHPTIENFEQRADEIHSGKISIEGTITDDENKFVDSAAIFFDNVKVATSNHMGYYKFEIENITLKNHIVSFSKHQYRWTAFSFHPLMGNTSINTTMCNYMGKECYSMGMPARPQVFFEKMTFKLKSISAKINGDIEFKRHVDSLAVALRNSTTRGSFDPVIFKMYFAKEGDKKLYLQKAQEILDYLVEMQGIDRDRIQLRVTKSPQKANMIEVVDYTED